MKATCAAILSIVIASSSYADDVMSQANNRDVKFLASSPKESGFEPNGLVKLVVEGKDIWSISPGYGGPTGSEISWSPFATKAAISVRTTKTTSEVHLIDVWETKRELKMPDIAGAVRAMNGGKVGRAFLMSPAGWADEDHVLIRVYGNLVDSGGTDGIDNVNFCYVFLIELSTQRVVSVTCTSRHNLNSKQLIEPQRGANPPPPAAPAGGSR